MSVEMRRERRERPGPLRTGAMQQILETDVCAHLAELAEPSIGL